MATTSLPSFAQAFSDPSMGSISSGNNSLPPIQHRRAKSPVESNGRKRARAEITSVEEQPEPNGRVKEEDQEEGEASSSKKRRLGLGLNTNVRANSETTPISPVVMGFGYSVMRDNPTAIDQVRSSISAKQKQKALIEQRRGSTVGIDETTGPTPPPPPPQHSLPAPPISFARRRAEHLGGKRKPADIIISPREAHTKEQFQPAIQSAPPIPQAGRYPMSLPRLPPVMGTAERKVAGIVPPTPTRLAMQRHHSSNAIPSISHPNTNPTTTTRSPPAASVPISSTLVPPTPTSLQHATYTGDKAAFLAPFEVFYDALNDSKQLKTWLGDQLQKSNALIQNLTQQQEKLNDTVELLVERRIAPMRSEMTGLYRRVEELEEALRAATGSGRRQSVDSGMQIPKGKKPVRNGNMLAADYTFPPRPPGGPRRPTSPTYDSETGSPAPFDSRRLSTSATRLDPPRAPSFETSSQRNTHSTPPQGFRDNPLSRSPSHGRTVAAEKPALPRTHSSSQPGSRGGSASPEVS